MRSRTFGRDGHDLEYTHGRINICGALVRSAKRSPAKAADEAFAANALGSLNGPASLALTVDSRQIVDALKAMSTDTVTVYVKPPAIRNWKQSRDMTRRTQS